MMGDPIRLKGVCKGSYNPCEETTSHGDDYHLSCFDWQIMEQEDLLKNVARENEARKRLMKISGKDTYLAAEIFMA